MRTHWLGRIGIVLVVALLVVACAPDATPPPAATPAATPEPGATPAPGTTPGEPVAPGEPAAPGEPVTIAIWHGYIETEERLLSEAINDFRDQYPNITVDVLAVPFEELQAKFQTEAAAGTGPTLIVGPQDRMAAYDQAGLLAEIDEAAFLGNLQAEAVEGGRIEGRLLGVPVNSKVVALYYNTSVVDTPPETMEELLEMASDHGLAITRFWFHNYMWVPAFGAELFDDDYRCVLHETGAAEALAYLGDVCASPGVVCDSNDGNADSLFRTGEVAFRIQGPWMAGDAIRDLGAVNVAVTNVPMVDGQDYPRPWNQVEVYSINVDATPQQREAAMLYLEYMTGSEVQQRYLDEANWIPANAAVDPSGNPVVAGFLEQVPYSDPFPVVPELAATWEPMDDAVSRVVEGVTPADQAVQDACQLINTANQRN